MLKTNFLNDCYMSGTVLRGQKKDYHLILTQSSRNRAGSVLFILKKSFYQMLEFFLQLRD